MTTKTLATAIALGLMAAALTLLNTDEACARELRIAQATAAIQGPDCAMPAPACAPVCGPAACLPTITYQHHGCRKVCCGCEPPIETALEVKDPCDCSCAGVIIPICLPACCTGVPEVTSRCGMFGRGVVRYDYCCGFSIKIVFRHTGDIVVHYIGG